jgi:hypothetical protein
MQTKHQQKETCGAAVACEAGHKLDLIIVVKGSDSQLGSCDLRETYWLQCWASPNTHGKQSL